MRTMIVTVAVTVAVIMAASSAKACSCAAPPAAPKALESSSAVFEGKVTKVNAAKTYGKEVTVEVKRRWKGVEKAKTVTVHTGNGGGDCGYRFKVGTSYLIYCYGKGKLSTGICSRTKPSGNAAGDVAALGAAKK